MSRLESFNAISLAMCARRKDNDASQRAHYHATRNKLAFRRRLYASPGCSGPCGAFAIEGRQGQLNSFIGRLSRDGKLITDLASGEISGERGASTIRWRGTIRYPAAVADQLSDSSSVRLDCDDGFAVEIHLWSSNPKIKSDWIDAIFTSNGPPLA
jgi:hypothetical protein